MATAKKKKNNRKKSRSSVRPIQWILVLVLFAALIFVITVLLKGNPEANTDQPDSPMTTDAPEQLTPSEGSFAPGTKVNGVNISGMNIREARKALEESVNDQLDGFSLTLNYLGADWTMDGTVCALDTDVDSVLEQAAQSGGTHTTSVTVDPSVLEKYLKSIAVDINCTPVEPELVFDPELAVPALTPEPVEGEPTPTPAPAVVPFTISGGENGATLDVDASITAILEGIAQGSSMVDLVVNEIEPSVTAENMHSSVALISSFTTEFSTRDSGRTHNLQLAADKLNGTVIAPGTTFSFNEVVGPRDEANGWREAKVIIGGSRYEDGWGGGICQVSTTLYNALLLTGADFNDFSRVNHSIPSDYVPKGLDATVAYGSKDFTFTNTSSSNYYVAAFTTNTDKSTGSITFQIYGPALAEGMVVEVESDVVNTLNPPDPEIIPDATEPSTYKVELQKERKGYVVDVTRTITVNGTVQKEEKLYTDTYKSVQGIFTVGTAEETTIIPEDDSLIPVE